MCHLQLETENKMEKKGRRKGENMSKFAAANVGLVSQGK